METLMVSKKVPVKFHSTPYAFMKKKRNWTYAWFNNFNNFFSVLFFFCLPLFLSFTYKVQCKLQIEISFQFNNTNNFASQKNITLNFNIKASLWTEKKIGRNVFKVKRQNLKYFLSKISLLVKKKFMRNFIFVQIYYFFFYIMERKGRKKLY